jgi:DNA-directed RNA polymerase alpha subunit
MDNSITEALNLPRDSEGERVYIPSAFHGRSIKSFVLSVRLANILANKNIRLAGELHGLNYRDFLRWQNCGRKTVAELQNVVRQMQSGSDEIAVARTKLN